MMLEDTPKCRVCKRPAKWVLTNVAISRNPFLCENCARAVPYSTMNMVRLKSNKKKHLQGVTG